MKIVSALSYTFFSLIVFAAWTGAALPYRRDLLDLEDCNWVPLSTYVFSASSFSLTPVAGQSDSGRMYELSIPKSDVASSVPLVVHDIAERHLYQEVVDPDAFLGAWAKASARAESKGQSYPLPSLAEVERCMEKFPELASAAEETGLERFSADALIAFHAPGLPAIVADILRVDDIGDSYVWDVQMAPSNATIDAPETGCRSPGQVYHHPTRCLAIETGTELDASSLRGNGMTAFVKVSSALSELHADKTRRSNRALPQLKTATNMSQEENSLEESCPEGSHKTPLNTYFVTMDTVTVNRLEEYADELGSFIQVGFPKSRLPASIPFAKSDMEARQMFEDVLNSTEFFSTWAKLATKASPLNGTFAMPWLNEASQCFERYQQQVLDDDLEAKGIDQVPSNAMLVFDVPGQEGVVADVFDVIDAGDSYLWHLRVAPSQAPMDTREGECHPYQSLKNPHYHHVSRCLGADVTSLDVDRVNGTGMTAFVRIGPLVDTGIVAVGADLIGSAGADAAVDAGVDVASDVASDAGSDY